MMRRVLLLLALFTCLCASALACDWPYLSPQQAAHKSTAVFVGRALDRPPGGQLFDPISFVVEEAFKGVSKGETIVIGPGPGNCVNLYRSGERYLIFAFPQRGGLLDASKGTGSSTLAEASAAALRWLRRGSDPAWKTQLIGVVLAVDSAFGAGARKPLPGAKVVLAGEGGPFTAITDSEGVFEFGPLPAGSYQMKASFPGRWSNPQPREVQVGECCEFPQIGLPIDGHISGVVHNAAGTQVAGERVELVSADPRWKDVQFVDAVTAVTGDFLFEGIPPGEYLIGFGLHATLNGRPRYAQTYKTVSLGRNQQITGIELQVPEPLPERQIVIHAVMSDGRAAAGATIVFGPDRPISPRSVQADSRGEARITWVQSVGLTVDGRWQDGEHGRFFSSTSKTIVAKDLPAEITIELVERK